MTDITITEAPSSPSSNSGVDQRCTLLIDFDKAAQQRLAADRRQQEHYGHLAQAYAGGMSLLAVAQANHTSVRMVRRALRAVGLGSRRSGPAGLTAEQHQLLLDADLAGTPHHIIASQLGISAERVRQIARAAGRTSLRQRRKADLIA